MSRIALAIVCVAALIEHLFYIAGACALLCAGAHVLSRS